MWRQYSGACGGGGPQALRRGPSRLKRKGMCKVRLWPLARILTPHLSDSSALCASPLTQPPPLLTPLPARLSHLCNAKAGGSLARTPFCHQSSSTLRQPSRRKRRKELQQALVALAPFSDHLCLILFRLRLRSAFQMYPLYPDSSRFFIYPLSFDFYLPCLLLVCILVPSHVRPALPVMRCQGGVKARTYQKSLGAASYATLAESIQLRSKRKISSCEIGQTKLLLKLLHMHIAHTGR